MEVELLLAAGLPVGKSRVLFGVSDHKFNLVAKPVIPSDLFGAEIGIGGGKDNLLLTWTDQKYDSEVTPKVGAARYCCEHPNLRLIWKTADLVEAQGELFAVIPVNFTIVLLRPAGPVLRRSGM